ncbi:MAG: hypothetical protein LC643_01135 [Bacteroidales bacterium]|nr:hypothetical protein [Bacteroidales bacterium]
MRGIEKLIVVVLLLVGWEVSSQETHSGVRDIWASISGQDDYEKNFRFPAFLESLKGLEELESIDSLKSHLPPSWSYAIDADTSMVVMAGVLSYELEPDRLVWLVQERSGRLKTSVFTTQLSASVVVNTPLNVQLVNYEMANTHFTSLAISVGSSLVFDLPDIFTRLVLQDLVESTSDDEKLQLSQQLWVRMEKLLGSEALFENDFSGYERVSTLRSPDGLIKVMTWNVELENGINTFRGAIAVMGKGQVVVHALKDSYKSIKNPEQASLSASKWYGAVYYELVEHTYRRNTYYTLLGYNPNTPFSKIRVVEVLSLSPNGVPRFGNAILEVEGRNRRRLIFEYSNRVSMMLRYDADERMIVMDNLVPSAPMFQNDYRHYGPDFTHNGLRFEKGKWLYLDNIELRNRRVR